MRFQILTFIGLICLAMLYGPICLAEVGGNTNNSTQNFSDVPQEFVVCTGWHALCSASTDCIRHGDTANCDCYRVNEAHVVETNEIQDNLVKNLTLSECTKKHPCDVDQSPVCYAIKYGQYKVNEVKYDWVSTFSYRGWCSLLNLKPTACDQNAKLSVTPLHALKIRIHPIQISH